MIMNVLLYYPGIDLNLNIASTIHTRNLVSNLSNPNNNYTLIASSVNKYIGDHIKFINVPLLTGFPFATLIKEIYSCIYLIIIKLISGMNIDIIYQRETIIGSGTLLKMVYGCTLVTEVNGIISEERTDILRILQFLNRLQLVRSDAIVAVSHDIKSKIMGEVGEKCGQIEVIENGVDIDIFKPMDMSICKSELGLKSDYNYICYVGSLEPWQCVDDLIECATYLKSKSSDVRFLIVGDGSEMEYLKTLSKNKGVDDIVIFIGRVKNTEVAQYINCCAMCISPFAKKRKASPLKLLEYLACGKIVFTQNISFIKDYKLDTMVKVIDTTNPKLLAEAIVETINENKLQNKYMSRKIRKNFTWNDTASKVEKLLERYGQD